MMKVLSIFLLISISYCASAQLYISPGASMSIGNLDVAIQGDAEIDGAMTNEGNLFLNGNWANNGSYASQSGMLILSSSSSQNISQLSGELPSLAIEGGGTISLSQDLIISRSMDLTNGIIESSVNTKLIFRDGSTVNGGSNASYVNGPCFYEGNGTFLFPVGVNNEYLPARLNNIEGNAQISIQVKSSFFTPIATGLITEINTSQYWELGVQSGDFLGAGVSLSLNNNILAISENEKLIVAQSDDPDGEFSSLGTTGLLDQYVTSARVANQPVFAVAKEREVQLRLANLLSTNGDGFNDVLEIENIDLFPENEITIVNRQGVIVHTIQNYSSQDPWDGTVNGEFIPPGGYIVVVKAGDGTNMLKAMLTVTR